MLIALFMKPADPKAFGADDHGTQLPLARTLPGLRGYESGLTTTGPRCLYLLTGKMECPTKQCEGFQ